MAQGASVTIGSNGEATISITAADGTTTKDYTVTVSIAAKRDFSTVTLLYQKTIIRAVYPYGNAIGITPAWDAVTPTPEGITYSILGATTGGPRTDGSTGVPPVVVIDPATGQDYNH